MSREAQSPELRARSVERLLAIVLLATLLMHAAVVGFVCWAFTQARSVSFPLMPKAAAVSAFQPFSVSAFPLRGVVPAVVFGQRTLAGGYDFSARQEGRA